MCCKLISVCELLLSSHLVVHNIHFGNGVYIEVDDVINVQSHFSCNTW